MANANIHKCSAIKPTAADADFRTKLTTAPMEELQ